LLVDLAEHLSSTATKKEVVWVAWDLLAFGREEGGQNDNFLDHHDEMKWGPKSKNKSSRKKQEKYLVLVYNAHSDQI